MSMKTAKTKIKFEYEGKKYTLEYTADSLKKLEKRGFDFFNAESRLIGAGEDLFAGAFIANHDDVPEAKRLEIYHEFTDAAESGEGLDEAIITMLNEAITEIRSHRGNVKWTIAK